MSSLKPVSGTELPICRTCGVQYAAPRADCPICLDERQYVGWEGQRWTSVAELRNSGHRGRLREEGPGVVGVAAEPSVAIGQRALLLRSPTGNVLWDCLGYLDDELAAEVEKLGGISAIAVSHPHFHGAMTEWGRAFDAPVYVHAADRDWVGRPDPLIEYWSGDTHPIAPGMTLINAGTHFAGGTVLHWADDPEGHGALFSGDIFMVVMDRRWVSFMYSIPNFIPERPRTVRRALRLVEPFGFERIYGAFWGRVVTADGAAAVRRSAERYLRFALDDDKG
ncbi:MBL fold metallo-hydrolase [Streptomyces sp. NBC_00140]|uniref:MBL fold metallo-hydrolase n=1 Tax=Streptomyces sp. NBC_00140 TaxID=2975664 RepID=UPI002257C1A6|nr:MBL fold metallo-hydrolase [Streptomyces sp. NBC_00140]MCX5331410.1 MBL fold metallo-hydrolase [Streptomyces sp. NBC_00140]